jgi:predicted nucleic acid-binding Zn ribbon protein
MYILVCKKCNEKSEIEQDNIRWAEHGTYSAKITKCPKCGAVNVIKTINAPGLFVNNDERYYF